MRFTCKNRAPFAALLWSLWLLASCSGLPLAGQIPSPQLPPTATYTASPAATAALTPQATPTPGVVTLRLWVPPRLDPDAGTPAGELFQARLDAFAKRRPGVRLEVRVKALDGAGGMLEALSAASAAAPLALPDLVAMPHDLMKVAALEGFLYPLDNLTASLDSADWYAYAQEMARLQDSIYGLPFAGDAQVMVYNPAVVNEAPQDWAKTIEAGSPLIFPAADPQALFTLAMYQANGGEVSSQNGAASLDAERLSQVLVFYAEAEQAQVMPYWLTQYQSDEQVWQAFLEDRTAQAVTWASNYLLEPTQEVAMAALPTPDGQPSSLATGWVWALATPPSENQPLSVELAEFLTEGNFLLQWNQALGYLPVRPSALVDESGSTQSEVIGRVLTSATLLPESDLLMRVGPALQEATMDVLKQQADPLTAAQLAAASLAEP